YRPERTAAGYCRLREWTRAWEVRPIGLPRNESWRPRIGRRRRTGYPPAAPGPRGTRRLWQATVRVPPPAVPRSAPRLPVPKSPPKTKEQEPTVELLTSPRPPFHFSLVLEL